MNMKIFILLVSFLFVLDASARVSYKGHQVLRVEPRNSDDRLYLRELGDHFKLQFWKEPERAFGFVDVVVPENKLQTVKVFLWESNIPYDVMISDLEQAITAQISPRNSQMTLASFDYNVYHPFDEIQEWMKNFVTTQPNHLTLMKVGMSYENRTFHAIKISTGGHPKPAFAIDCGIHANEWIGPATCIHVIQNLTENIGKSTMAGRILEAVDYYIIPSANPDGYHYTWTTDRMWRKTRSPSTSKPSCVGVDPNRNWDSNFGGNGSSNDPCSDDYHGPHAWSEANVRAQRDFVNGLPDLQAYIDVHSYSQLWMFPYGFTFNKPKDFELLSRIANASVEAIKKVHDKEYTPGQISKVIYVASGSTADYFYDHLKLKCVFAAELRDKGKYGMLLPEDQIQPTAEEIFAGLIEIAANIMEGHCAKM